MPPNKPSNPKVLATSADQDPEARAEAVTPRSKDEREFLPAALEILESPASPAARAVALTLTAFFTIALIWSIVGHVDVVAVAQGRIIPTGGVQTIQSLEIGVVRAIHVRDGQAVKKGDKLIELDPTESEVDKEQMERERMAALVDLSRLEALLRALFGKEPNFAPPKGADPSLIALHRQRLRSDIFAHQAQLASFEGEFARRVADREAIKAEIAKLKATIPLVEERDTALKGLTEKGNAPRRLWLEVRQTLIEQRQNTVIQRHRLTESQAGMISAQKERRKIEAEARRDALAEMVEAKDKAIAADLALRKALQRETLRHLIAPVDGTVQQLEIHTVGGVVTPAQPLMVLVPADAPLEIEAMVLNKDKGFVEAGQIVEIKVESFPFTKYGTIDGVLKHMSGDAIVDEELGPVYASRVSLDRAFITVDGEDIPLGPGMAVTVEIKTGKRRVIEYIISPLLRYKDESLRER